MPNRNIIHRPAVHSHVRSLAAIAESDRLSSSGNVIAHSTHRSASSYLTHLRGKKTVVYIDGANYHATTKHLGFVTEYSKLRDLFRNICDTVELHYFVAINYGDRSNPSVYVDTIAWMQDNGYTIHHKSTKSIYDRESQTRQIKGNMDVEMAVEAMATPDDVSDVVLFTGDGDFCALVRALQARGKRVTVISAGPQSSRRAAEDLIAVSDTFVDLDHLKSGITRYQIAQRQDMPRHYPRRSLR